MFSPSELPRCAGQEGRERANTAVGRVNRASKLRVTDSESYVSSNLHKDRKKVRIPTYRGFRVLHREHRHRCGPPPACGRGLGWVVRGGRLGGLGGVTL